MLSNILTILFAINQGWSVGEVMWIFWAQSVVIGVTNFFRIWNLREFSTGGLTMNDRPVQENVQGKKSTAKFFLIHYGFFHLIYLVFLFADHPITSIPVADLILIFAGFGAFGVSHTFSLVRNAPSEFRDKKPNLGAIMFYPYLRIIPMHFTIIFGSMFGGGALMLFLLLKTFADAGMHMVERRLFK